MEDYLIVRKLFERNESALEELAASYRSYCFSVARNILRDESDCEEVLNDTWLKVWNSVPPNRPNDLKHYCARIARNTALDLYEKNKAQKRGGSQVEISYEELEEVLGSADSSREEMKLDNLHMFINDYLATVSLRDRIFFVRRYFWFESEKEIAQRYGYSQAAVRNSLYRTRKGLREYLIREEYF